MFTQGVDSRSATLGRTYTTLLVRFNWLSLCWLIGYTALFTTKLINNAANSVRSAIRFSNTKNVHPVEFIEKLYEEGVMNAGNVLKVGKYF